METADCRAGELLLYHSRVYNAALLGLDREEPEPPSTSLLGMRGATMPGQRVCLVLLVSKDTIFEEEVKRK